jgi:glycosyltransferase involved in cell wall biosynthesis
MDTLQPPETWRSWKVVLSHDWLTGMRGGERVLDLLGRAFPDAPLYTLIHNRAAVSPAINAHPIHTSWLQRVPGIQRHYRYFLPLYPAAVSGWRPPAADLVISTSHCVAKAIRVPAGARHLCYCFTPMRYAWTFYRDYFGNQPIKNALVRPLLAWLRRWDRRTAGTVDRFVAISRHVQDRIRKFYGRESDVVYPPVNTDFYTPYGPRAGTFDLIVSALVPYKRIDLAVQTYNRLRFPLKIVGVGTELKKLQTSAGPHIEFMGWQSDEAVRDLYRQCRCLVFPGEEDFGIVPVEAQACGCPVVALDRGGARETVKQGQTGVFFPEQTESALATAVETCAHTAWNPDTLRRHAEQFGVARFLAGLDDSLRKCMAGRRL